MTFSHAVIINISVLFFKIIDYETSVEDDVSGDTSGMFRRVLVSLLTVSPQNVFTSSSLIISHGIFANANVLSCEMH